MKKAAAPILSLILAYSGSDLSAQDGSELAPRGLEAQAEGRLPFGKREAVAPVEVDNPVVLVPNLTKIKLTASGGVSGTELKSPEFPGKGRIEAVGLTVDLGGLAKALGPFM